MSREKQTGFRISKESVDKIFPKKDIDILGYESPINVVMGQMRMEQENNIFKAIREYGVNVDKDELIKALQYDRNQYEKGYINGYNTKASEVAREIFEEIFFHTYYSHGRPIIEHSTLLALQKKYTESEKDK